MLASDLQNPEFVGARNPDSLLYVKFYMETLQNNFKTEKEGRPMFEDELRIMIQPTGNNLLCVHHRADEGHKRRFPFQWQQFMNSQVDHDGIQGTPLSAWPALTRAQSEELRGIKFYTVEQIANASDAQLQCLGMAGRMYQQKAQAFLASAQGTAAAQQQAAELARQQQENADLKAEMKRLSAQMEGLLAAQTKNHPLSLPKK